MSMIQGILGGVGSATSAFMSGEAEKSALDKINAALDQQQGIDIDAMKQAAAEGDTEKFAASLNAQKQVDPALAKLRATGASDLADVLQNDFYKKGEDSVIKTLLDENVPMNQKQEQVKNMLLDRAKENLDAGAKLSPTYQAELVRAGLATGAGGGIPTAEGPAGVQARELIGVQGENLKMARASQAAQLGSAADQMTAARAQILNNLIPTLSAVQNSRLQRAGAGFQIANQAMPSIGLGGGDIVNMNLSNLAQKNAIILQKAQVQGQKDVAGSSELSGIISGFSGMSGSGGGGGGGVALNLGNFRNNQPNGPSSGNFETDFNNASNVGSSGGGGSSY